LTKEYLVNVNTQTLHLHSFFFSIVHIIFSPFPFFGTIYTFYGVFVELCCDMIVLDALPQNVGKVRQRRWRRPRSFVLFFFTLFSFFTHILVVFHFHIFLMLCCCSSIFSTQTQSSPPPPPFSCLLPLPNPPCGALASSLSGHWPSQQNILPSFPYTLKFPSLLCPLFICSHPCPLLSIDCGSKRMGKLTVGGKSPSHSNPKR
jgi:hypothetical protein